MDLKVSSIQRKRFKNVEVIKLNMKCIYKVSQIHKEQNVEFYLPVHAFIHS